jgi:hypothetical protein
MRILFKLAADKWEWIDRAPRLGKPYFARDMQSMAGVDPI